MASITTVVTGLPPNATSSHVVDRLHIDEAFAVPPVHPLARFIAALHMDRANYAEAQADEFFQRLGDEIARRLFDSALTDGVRDAPASVRVAAGAVATSIRNLVLATLPFLGAYDFLERLEAA